MSHSELQAINKRIIATGRLKTKLEKIINQLDEIYKNNFATLGVAGSFLNSGVHTLDECVSSLSEQVLELAEMRKDLTEIEDGTE